MNPLEMYPRLRNALYVAQWCLSGVLLVVTAVVLALGESPVWLLAVTAGFNAFTGFTGFTAGGNVEPGQSFESDPNLMMGDGSLLIDDAGDQPDER